MEKLDIGVLPNDNKELVKNGYSSPRISSEMMDCSLPLTFDQYSKCSFGCKYCFSSTFKENNPSTNKGLLQVNTSHLKKNILGEIENVWYNLFYKKKFPLHWGGLADPFCHYEVKHKTGIEILQFLIEQKYPTLFSTKGISLLGKRIISLLEKAQGSPLGFQFSIVTGGDELAKYLERGAPLPSQRFRFMKILSEIGYYTILRLRPYIIGITDNTIDKILEESLRSGIKSVSMEFFAMDIRCSNKAKYEAMQGLTGIKDIPKYFAKISPPERGGYRRLNRLIKERYIKKVYKFCVDNSILFTCSDPDYKELNMSGSCCGLPEENHPLSGWEKNQLTYHLKEARKAYHITGEKRNISFNSIFGEEKDDSFLNKNELVCQNVITWNKSTSYKKSITLMDVVVDHWNNLNSPSNPYNYFNGKLIPIGKEDSMVIYQYNPMEYEQRWKEEGINLCL